MQFEDQPAPSCPSDLKTGPSEEGANVEGSDLEEPLELKPVVASFLRGLWEASKDEGDRMPPEPTVLEFSQWVPWKEEDESPKTLSTNVPEAPCVPEPTLERRGPKFLGWEKVLHPSQPVVATGEIPQPFKASRPKVGPVQLPQTLPVKPPASPPKTPTPHKCSLPVQALALILPQTLLHNFAGVTACLQMPQLVEVALEAPLGTMPIGLVATPKISTMSMSHIIRDKATGITYMDTGTTSIGRVAFSGPDSEALLHGPYDQGCY